MIDRYRSNLRRTRRYADPFGEEGAASDRDVYVRWLGLRCKERTLFVVGLTLAGIMVALLVAKSLLDGRVSWLPTGVLWFEIGFLTCIVLLSITACSMFICGSIAVRRQIRNMNAQIARWDDATPEEVEAIVRESDRRLNRRVFWRALFWLVAMLALFALFGTTLLFPWGGTAAFVASVLTVVAATAIWSWRGSRILSFANRWVKPSPRG